MRQYYFKVPVKKIIPGYYLVPGMNAKHRVRIDAMAHPYHPEDKWLSPPMEEQALIKANPQVFGNPLSLKSYYDAAKAPMDGLEPVSDSEFQDSFEKATNLNEAKIYSMRGCL